MRPQHRSPALHLRLQHAQLEIRLSTPTLPQIIPHEIHALVDLLVLPQQLRGVLASLELGHLSRQDGKDVPFLNGVMRFEVRDELQAEGEKLAEGEVGGAATGLAGVPEGVPGLAEVVVLGKWQS